MWFSAHRHSASGRTATAGAGSAGLRTVPVGTKQAAGRISPAVVPGLLPGTDRSGRCVGTPNPGSPASGPQRSECGHRDRPSQSSRTKISAHDRASEAICKTDN